MDNTNDWLGGASLNADGTWSDVSPNGGSNDGSNGGFWNAFAGLGKTTGALITALNTPSASDVAAAQAKAKAKQSSTTLAMVKAYAPFVLGGLLVLGVIAWIARR